MDSKKILSKDNEKIKFLRKLQLKKFRDQNSKFVVENLNMIYDGLKSGFDFEQLFATEEFIAKNKDKFQELIGSSKINEYCVIGSDVNKLFSSLENPPGICAVYPMLGNKIDYNSNVVYLNNINDPGNMGTIIRSALAFGFDNIVIDNQCVDLYNAKTVQAAKDAIFKLNFCFGVGLDILNKIKTKMKVICSVSQGGTELGALNLDGRQCVVIGNEAHGIDEPILKLADYLITIKTSGRIESLNAASAATVIFYNIYNKQ